jgi:hypothetical protein
MIGDVDILFPSLPSVEQTSQPDFAEGAQSGGELSLSLSLEYNCVDLSVGKRKRKSRANMHPKKRKQSQGKQVFVSASLNTDTTADLFPEDLSGSLLQNSSVSDVCCFGVVSGAQDKLLAVFCELDSCKRPCLRCRKGQRVLDVPGVLNSTVSLFAAQTPVGVTQVSGKISSLEEEVIKETSNNEHMKVNSVSVCNVSGDSVVVCKSHKKVRKRHEHLSDWCPPGALDIVNEGIHNLTDPSYGICSVKRVLSQTESIILSFGASFIPAPKPVTDEKVIIACDKFANSVRAVNDRYHKISNGRMSNLDRLLRVETETYSYPKAADKVETYLDSVKSKLLSRKYVSDNSQSAFQ